VVQGTGKVLIALGKKAEPQKKQQNGLKGGQLNTGDERRTLRTLKLRVTGSKLLERGERKGPTVLMTVYKIQNPWSCEKRKPGEKEK